MDDYGPTRSLAIAIFAQAARDAQSRAPARRREAEAFLRSDGLGWVWEAASDGWVGVPDTDRLRQRILAGQLAVPRLPRYRES